MNISSSLQQCSRGREEASTMCSGRKLVGGTYQSPGKREAPGMQ